MRRAFIPLVFVALAFASIAAGQSPPEPAPVRGFVHPGLLHSAAEIEFVRTKLAHEPWRFAWGELRKSKYASTGWKPKPRAEVVRDQHHRELGADELRDDALAAYTQALQWALTRNQTHARKAIEILNAWSGKLVSITGHDAKLLAGMTGYKLCNAAELIRHTGAAWPAAEEERFRKMLTNVFLPPVRDFHPKGHGSWDAAAIVTTMSIAVYTDDRALYSRALEYCRDGEGSASLRTFIQPSGYCREHAREQGHAQRALGFLSDACETAWKQGDELWGAHDSRLAAAFEFTAKYNLGMAVDTAERISPEERGRLRPIYEKVLRHYRTRKRMEMPFTVKAADKIRPEGLHWDHAPWGTLMFAQQPP